jgi:SAM-dependent methyltransferase
MESLFSPTRLDLSLFSDPTPPPLFSRTPELFWNDPYIATQMLAAHLDPNTEAASRKPETIAAIVAWIADRLQLGRGSRLVDLGCGPGLYTQRIAQMGCQVTGVDFSANSLAYARQQAEAAGLSITYRQQNYLELDDHEAYDVALLIYYDLGALTDPERDTLLPRIAAALKPGGAFVFDVTTRRFHPEEPPAPSWSYSAGGFWRPCPYMQFQQAFNYPDPGAWLDQYRILTEDGSLSTYRIWERYYTLEGIRAALAKAGFTLAGVWSDLAGAPFEPDSQTMGIVAIRS